MGIYQSFFSKTENLFLDVQPAVIKASAGAVFCLNLLLLKFCALFIFRLYSGSASVTHASQEFLFYISIFFFLLKNETAKMVDTESTNVYNTNG